MKKLLTAFVFCALALCFILSTESMAFEVTKADVAGSYGGTVEVVNPPNPGLVGFFKCRPSDKPKFAYALIKEGDGYAIYVKWDAGRSKGSTWTDAVIDGNTIKYGSSGKIWITDSGKIYRTHKGKYKVRLKPAE
jgi:hypothetical protein